MAHICSAANFSSEMEDLHQDCPTADLIYAGTCPWCTAATLNQKPFHTSSLRNIKWYMDQTGSWFSIIYWGADKSKSLVLQVNRKICEIKKAISFQNTKTAECWAWWHVIFTCRHQSSDSHIKLSHGIVRLCWTDQWGFIKLPGSGNSEGARCSATHGTLVWYAWFLTWRTANRWTDYIAGWEENKMWQLNTIFLIDVCIMFYINIFLRGGISVSTWVVSHAACLCSLCCNQLCSQQVVFIVDLFLWVGFGYTFFFFSSIPMTIVFPYLPLIIISQLL